ncbi:hypothetical protein C7N43_38120 [Sphingobacteriales bacterium UPWRP_1]|nr:hypothetical protein B6N25_06655 [Sphingobacteriales bacterium TSM_CSS]PSJ71669.1 hypothetical protein C7N43_38120 [Sphingobacteriales bacterium UPWRP_1]
MDKDTLKQHCLKVIESFTDQGHSVELAGIVPLYPQLPTTSYVLQVFSTWLNQMPTCNAATNMVIARLYELMPREALRYINRVEICDENGEIHCMSDDLIINDLNFQPLSIPYNYAEDNA